jgi:hypothetical protein
LPFVVAAIATGRRVTVAVLIQSHLLSSHLDTLFSTNPQPASQRTYRQSIHSPQHLFISITNSSSTDFSLNMYGLKLVVVAVAMLGMGAAAMPDVGKSF